MSCLPFPKPLDLHTYTYTMFSFAASPISILPPPPSPSPPATPRVPDEVICYFDIEYRSPTGRREYWGRIEFLLYTSIAPKTAENFRALCTGEKGYGYRRTKFHRVIEGFVAQGGDITRGDGTGGKSIYGTYFDDENFIIKHEKPYLLSMVNSGPNTNSSQFFINFAPATHLDGKHVVFGEVVAGKEILKMIEEKGKNKMTGKLLGRVLVRDCGQVMAQTIAEKLITEENNLKGRSRRRRSPLMGKQKTKAVGKMVVRDCLQQKTTAELHVMVEANNARNPSRRRATLMGPRVRE